MGQKKGINKSIFSSCIYYSTQDTFLFSLYYVELLYPLGVLFRSASSVSCSDTPGGPPHSQSPRISLLSLLTIAPLVLNSLSEEVLEAGMT